MVIGLGMPVLEGIVYMFDGGGEMERKRTAQIIFLKGNRFARNIRL